MGKLASILVIMLSPLDLDLDLGHSVVVSGFHSILCLVLLSSPGLLDRHLSQMQPRGILLDNNLRQVLVQHIIVTTVVKPAISPGRVRRSLVIQLSRLLVLLLGVELPRRTEVASHLLPDKVV